MHCDSKENVPSNRIIENNRNNRNSSSKDPITTTNEKSLTYDQFLYQKICNSFKGRVTFTDVPAILIDLQKEFSIAEIEKGIEAYSQNNLFNRFSQEDLKRHIQEIKSPTPKAPQKTQTPKAEPTFKPTPKNPIEGNSKTFKGIVSSFETSLMSHMDDIQLSGWTAARTKMPFELVAKTYFPVIVRVCQKHKLEIPLEEIPEGKKRQAERVNNGIKK